MKKKKYFCKKHFETRCFERLGIAFDQNDLKEKMKNGQMNFLFKQSNTKTHWKMQLENGQNIELVYDKLRNCFVTLWKI